MKSRIYTLPPLVLSLFKRIADDNIGLYAAQASFFTIISAVPFISLLLSIIGIALPAGIPELEETASGFGKFTGILGKILLQLESAPNVPLLSVSAVSTLWSASKGISSVRNGIERVYSAKRSKNILSHRIKSLLSTLIFISLITGAIVLLMFGNFLLGMISSVSLTRAVVRYRIPVLALFMFTVFLTMYSSTAVRSATVSPRVSSHIPGAVFSSAGWLIFSYFYSLYIEHFPGASYVYGGLAAVCLIMLWTYFCMIILLLGAELNKIFCEMRQF